jgi:hypothetical protein
MGVSQHDISYVCVYTHGKSVQIKGNIICLPADITSILEPSIKGSLQTKSKDSPPRTPQNSHK